MTVTRTLVLALGLSGCATTEQVQQLEEKVASLEEKVASLEAAPKSGGSAVDPKAEEAAKKLYEEVSELAAKGEMAQAQTKMKEMGSKYGSTTMYKRAKKLEAELEVIGKDAPTEWGIEKWYLGEDQVDLDSEQATLVVFWEVWCPHCRREVPNMKETYSTWSSKGLQVVGLTRITRSATEEKVVDFIKEQDVNYPMAKETGEAAKHFNVSGIPAAAIVKGGKIIWRGHPARLNDELLTKFLNS